MPLIGDSSGARRFAFAIVSPPSPSPGFVIRRALEELGGNPTFGLAASYYGSMMVLFPSEEVRESTIARMPIVFLGHTITLERPENADTRFSWRYSCFAQISATGFPLEHWNEGGSALHSVPSGVCVALTPSA